MFSSTDKQWQVQWRTDRHAPWQTAAGRPFERRSDARASAKEKFRPRVGFFNTRTVPYTKPPAMSWEKV